MGAERLLLVEDDSTTREVLTLLLETDAWSVLGVESGEAALETLRVAEPRPGVILCDLHLPGVHGTALAAALRRTAPKSTLLAITASEPGGEGAGYDGWLRKPFGAPDLRTALAALPTGHPAKRLDTDEIGAESSPGGTSVSELPVLATGTFLKLEQQMGLRVKELYAFALADTGDRLFRMEQSMREGDAAAYRAEAHALKGSAGMIGAQQLAALAAVEEAVPAHFVDSSRKNKVNGMYLACDTIRLMLETLFPI